MSTIEEWNRNGFTEKDGKLERISNGTTDIRSAREERGRANLLADNTGTAPELERDTGARTLGAAQAQGTVGARFLVRITSFRKRLLDEDNLCCKYVVDLCRYSGVIPSDAPGFTKIEVSQEKAGPKEPERIQVEVFRL